MPETVVIQPEQHSRYVAGRWYAPVKGSYSSGAGIAANTLSLLPFYVSRPITISDLGIRVTQAASGGNSRVAIYANDPATNLPTGAALAATGDISTTSTGGQSAAIVGGAVTLEQGWHWMAVLVDATAASATFQTLSAATIHAGYEMGSETLAKVTASSTNGALALSVANSESYGTWPDLTGDTFSELTTLASAVVPYKVSAVP